VARCQEMATLPAGYIPQCKAPSASSRGLLGFMCVCSVVGWLIVYQLVILSLSCKSIQSVDVVEMITPAYKELGTPVAYGLGLTPLIRDRRDTV
jgi:hypothetical protein